jgi:hypothetical protein
MSRVKAPVVVTANCLLTGQVVYLDAHHNWTHALQSAVCFDAIEAATDAMTSAGDEAVIIGAYLVPVTKNAGAISPTHYREAIRLEGPGAYIANVSRSAKLVPL